MFRNSLPVSGDSFFDRGEELDRLTTLVDHLIEGEPSWLAVIGHRKVGKTSLLTELSRRVAGRGAAFLIIDVLETHPVSLEFFRAYALRALDAVFSAELGLSIETAGSRSPQLRAALLDLESFRRLPAQLQAWVLDIQDAALDLPFVRACVELPQKLAVALKIPILVAIDEFQELASLGSSRLLKDVMPLLRSIWQKHRNVAYVISGSARAMLTELVTSERSPFFQHFALMNVGLFPEKEAIRLLRENASNGDEISLALATRCVEVLGSHPFYLQILGEALLVERGSDDARLKAALQNTLFSRTGRLGLHFELEYERLVGRSTFLSGVLEAVAEGERRLSEIAAEIGAPAGATARYVERLRDAIVRGKNGRYTLADPTFGLWLRWRKPGGTVVPMKLLGDEAELEIVRYLASAGFDLIYQSRGSRGAFDLLATRGAYQLGVQVKRARLPVRFKKSEWSRLTTDAKRFNWRFVVGVVDPQGAVHFLDPQKVRRGTEVTIGESAAIENILEWLSR